MGWQLALGALVAMLGTAVILNGIPWLCRRWRGRGPYPVPGYPTATTCPHCGQPLQVYVTSPYAVGVLEGPPPLGPDASGAHTLPPGFPAGVPTPTYEHWCGTCRDGAKGWHEHKYKPMDPGEESGATDA